MTTFTGTSGNDILPLIGADNSGDDILYGLAGNDTLEGGAGNDTLEGGLGADTLYGDTGVDTASYAGAAGTMNVSLTTGLALGSDAGAGGEHLYEVENLVGSAYRDLLYGNGGVNSLAGGDGNDLLQGYAGNDTLQGGNGDDTLDGGTGIDSLDGGAGVDTASYAGATGTMNVNLGSGLAFGSDAGPAGEHLLSFENLAGSRYGDVLSGSTGDNSLVGGGGNDSLYGNDGNDTLTGDDGNDTIQGGAGADNLDGGAGIDTVSYSSSTARVMVDLVDRDGWSDGAQRDTLYSFENVVGSAFDDVLWCDGAANLLDGGAGNDILKGRGGKDTLIGGAGADRFVFDYVGDSGPSSSQRDVIRDFSSDDGDRIDVGYDVFFCTFLGTGASFTGREGELTFALGLLEADVNGDRVADFSIQVDGVTTMSASDFVL